MHRNKILKLSFLLCPLLMFSNFHFLKAQTPLIRNNYQTGRGVPHLTIGRALVYSPDTEWLYNHHPSIIHFKNKFIAIWSNGFIDEDSPGQRVTYAISSDFVHWS